MTTLRLSRRRVLVHLFAKLRVLPLALLLTAIGHVVVDVLKEDVLDGQHADKANDENLLGGGVGERADQTIGRLLHRRVHTAAADAAADSALAKAHLPGDISGEWPPPQSVHQHQPGRHDHLHALDDRVRCVFTLQLEDLRQGGKLPHGRVHTFTCVRRLLRRRRRRKKKKWTSIR